MLSKPNVMRYFIFFFLSCIASATFAQDQFISVFGGDGYDYGVEVMQTADNGYLIAGTTSSFNPGMSSQHSLLKVSEYGHLEWRKTFGGAFSDVTNTMVEAADGNLLLVGFQETIENSYQFSALKLTPAGDSIWAKSYGMEGWDICKDAVATPDGGFALLGQSYGSGNEDSDFLLVRIDMNGDTLWTKTYGGAEDESGESISLTDDGGFYLAGNTESFGAGGVDWYVIRTDANGDTIWTETYGGIEDDFCHTIESTADGGYVVAGGSYNIIPDRMQWWLKKEGGTQQWTKTENHVGDSYISDVLIEPNQNVTIIGNMTPGPNEGGDGRIARYGFDGVWNGVGKDHGSSKLDEFLDVKKTSDGGYIIVGRTESYLERLDDVWLIKTDANGFTTNFPAGIDEILVGEESFEVRVVPNPVNEQSSLLIDGYQTIAANQGKPIELRVYNSVGRLVLSEQVNSSSTVLEVETLATGIHFYQLVSGVELLATGKLVKAN